MGCTKPCTTARINWANPVAHGLVFLTIGGYPVDLVTGQMVTLGGSATLQGMTVTADGPALESTVKTGADYAWWSDVLIALRVQDKHTMAAIIDIDDLDPGSRIITVPWNVAFTSPFFSMSLGAAGADTSYNHLWTVGAALQDSNGASYWPTSGRAAGTMTRDRATSSLFLNGKLFASVGGFATGVCDFSGDANHVVVLNHSKDSTGEGCDARLPFAAIWSRALEGSDIMGIFGDPWQLIAD